MQRESLMKKPPAIQTLATGILTVLSISPNEEDHSTIQSLFLHSRWKLLKARKISTAPELLEKHDVSVVVCERDLLPGTWVEVLEQIQPMPNPPSLIVSSRLADERLWAEALNLGAWDVLAKPFDKSEVLRSVKSAWQHWYNQSQLPAVMRLQSAAS